jgi:hypothetical protein
MNGEMSGQGPQFRGSRLSISRALNLPVVSDIRPHVDAAAIVMHSLARSESCPVPSSKPVGRACVHGVSSPSPRKSISPGMSAHIPKRSLSSARCVTSHLVASMLFPPLSSRAVNNTHVGLVILSFVISGPINLEALCCRGELIPPHQTLGTPTQKTLHETHALPSHPIPAT